MLEGNGGLRRIEGGEGVGVSRRELRGIDVRGSTILITPPTGFPLYNAEADTGSTSTGLQG